MNREIKFRAWDKELERICEVIKINFLMKTIIVFHPDEEEVSSYLPLTRFELMQYTGLKDKNSKEIYEGDILSNGQHIDWIVDFRVASFVVKHVGSITEDSWVLNRDMAEGREVIGNIYENPELLKGEETA